jgi:hypothetical protein
VYYCYVFVPSVTFGFVFGIYLDIVITVDRIGNFNRKVKDFMKLSAYKMCMIGFALCFLIDLPYCFAYMPNSFKTDVLFPDGRVAREYTVWYWDVTEFAGSETGKVIMFIVYAIRDFFLLIVEVGINIVSLYYIKKYFQKKNRLVIHPNAYSVATIAKALPANRASGTSACKSKQSVSSQSDKNNSAKVKASVMVLLMCLFSFCQNI